MGAQSAGQVWRGKVVRVLDDGMVWVVVPQLMGDEPLGPMPSHGATMQDARVLVVLLGGSRQDMVAVPDPDARFADVGNGLGALWDAMAGKQPAGDYVLGADPRLSDARTPKAHRHQISDVTGLDAELEAKQPAGDYATNAALTNGLAAKADMKHAHSVATPGVAGFMSVDDKTKLDAAGYPAYPGTIAMRNNFGAIEFAYIWMSQPQANGVNAVTRKDYVDAKIWQTTNLGDSSVTSTKLSAALRDLLDQYGSGIGDLQARATMINLGSTENLNDLVPSNNRSQSYGQALTANASLERNYPVDRAGMLEAFSNHSGNMVWQRYTVYGSEAYFAVYVRGKYNTLWTAWKKLAFETSGGVV